MPRAQRFLFGAGLMLAGLAVGCSSNAPPAGNVATGKAVPINRANTKKFIQPEPAGPPAPPIKR